MTGLEDTAVFPSTDKPFGITQIRGYIPIKLDMTKLNYDVWRELFETHCSSFGVLGHLDGSSAPTPADKKQWKEHDGLVKMWIYGTVSEQILDTILKAKATARDVWLTLENLFRDNKEARSLQYDNELRTLVIGDMSITDYTHKLKSLSGLLANLDSPVSDRTLVMHMLNGLSDKFDSIINVIKHQSPFQTFTKARSLLLMEEKRLEKQTKPVAQNPTNALSPTVLLTNQDQQQRSNSQDYSNNNNNSGRGYNNNNQNRGRGRNNRGRGCNNWYNNQFAYPPWGYGQQHGHSSHHTVHHHIHHIFLHTPLRMPVLAVTKATTNILVRKLKLILSILHIRLHLWDKCRHSHLYHKLSAP